MLPVDALIATWANKFPEQYPRDPADRMIGATALTRNVPLVTADERVRKCGVVEIIW